MGRTAGGVRGFKIAGTDQIVGAGIIKKGDKEAKILVMSELGFGKMTPVDEYKIQKRGGSGIKTANVTAKTGPVMVAGLVKDEVELIAMSKKGNSLCVTTLKLLLKIKYNLI